MTEKLIFQLNPAAVTQHCNVFMSMMHNYPTRIVILELWCRSCTVYHLWIWRVSNSDCWIMMIDQIYVTFWYWQMLQVIGGIYHQVRKPIGPGLICVSQQHWGWKLAKSSTWLLHWGQTCEKNEMQGLSKIWANNVRLHSLMEIVLLKVTEMLGYCGEGVYFFYTLKA